MSLAHKRVANIDGKLCSEIRKSHFSLEGSGKFRTFATTFTTNRYGQLIKKMTVQMKKLTFMVTTGLLMLALVTTGCGTKNAPSAVGETADSTAVEAEAMDESAYDLEAIAKAIEGCEDLTSFRSGLAGVEKDGKVGYIDKKGNVVVPFEYRSPTQVFCEDVVAVFKGDDVIYMDPKGKELFRTKSFGRFYDGLCSNREDVGPNKAGKIGFIDKTGKVVIPFAYEYTGDFSDGMCWVTKEDGRIGFIDMTGELVVPCQYGWPAERQPTDFHEGLCAVIVDEEHEWFGFIDKTGKRAFPGVYSGEANFSEGLAMVREILGDDEWRSGYIDKTGKIVIEMDDDRWGGEFHDGIAKVVAPNRTYFIDKTGKEVFELDEKYKNAEYYSEGTWLVNDGEHHMGFIDNTGKTIVPCKYYAYTPFSEGLAMVQDKQNGRYGFVDKEGKSTFEY